MSRIEPSIENLDPYNSMIWAYVMIISVLIKAAVVLLFLTTTIFTFCDRFNVCNSADTTFSVFLKFFTFT